MFTLAHLSDVHLGPMPFASPLALASKRLIGLGSWSFRRRRIHSNDILSTLVDDIKAHAPDHIAFTGDLANLSLKHEFARGAQWLKQLGTPDTVSFVPGNHDAYVRVPWANGLAQWGDYMVGDLKTKGVHTGQHLTTPFPYVRQRKNIALIGVSSAVPAPWNKAWGEVGARQLEALQPTLKMLGERGFYRVVMIHHPPIPGLAPDRKALQDAARMKDVLESAGAELVLHGHNHQHMHNPLVTKTGTAHIIGVPSASAHAHGEKPSAAWYEFQIDRQSGKWRTDMRIHAFGSNPDKVTVQSQLRLDHGC